MTVASPRNHAKGSCRDGAITANDHILPNDTSCAYLCIDYCMELLRSEPGCLCTTRRAPCFFVFSAYLRFDYTASAKITDLNPPTEAMNLQIVPSQGGWPSVESTAVGQKHRGRWCRPYSQRGANTHAGERLPQQP